MHRSKIPQASLFMPTIMALTFAWMGAGAPHAIAAEYTSPRALNFGDIYRIDPDGFTGDEVTTQPKEDLNDGLSGDNPYFRRTNVARAHDSGGVCGRYWYTSAYQEAGEPDPAGEQYVDYVPPFGTDGLPGGGYRLTAQYRYDANRASYPVEYIVHHVGGTTVVPIVQAGPTTCDTIELGTFDLGTDGFVRVNDTGSQSIVFKWIRFQYVFSADGVPAVEAGINQTVILPNPVSLNGYAADDGTPAPLVVSWSKVSGPGDVAFTPADAVVTSASFSASGTYVLRLTASDTQNTVYDDVTVDVLSNAIYSTQYEFDADPSTAAGVIDRDANDQNGAGLLTKVGTGYGNTGGGIAGGILRFLDNSSSGNHGFYWQNGGSDINFTLDIRVKANAGVGPTSQTTRRSMGVSAGANKNRGLRFNQPGNAPCTQGTVHFVGTSGLGTEACVDTTRFHNLRITANTQTNQLRVFDLESHAELAVVDGGGSGAAAEITNRGGFHIGSIAGSTTTLTDYEVDHVRILLGTAVEDGSTIIQSLIACGTSVDHVMPDVVTALLPGAPSPGQIVYTVSNTGSSAVAWTAIEADQNGDALNHSWLSLDKPGGSLDPGVSDTVTATLSTAGLTAGVYEGYVKFTDDCSPAGTFLRKITLYVYDCQFSVSPECRSLRSYSLDYSAALPAPVVLTVSNPGAGTLAYDVVEVNQNGVASDAAWLALDKTNGTVGGVGSDSVVAAIDPTGLAAGTYNAYLRFDSTSCTAPSLTRQITLTVMNLGQGLVFEYQGDVDPLTAGFVLRNETPMPVLQGAVEIDTEAADSKVWHIQDTTSAKTKLITSPAPFLSGGIGATVVGRLRVYNTTAPSLGGLFIWESPSITAECHWGGANGRLKEANRGNEIFLTDPSQMNNGFHIIRMTSVGLDDCNRRVRIYFDEDPTPVLDLTNISPMTTTPEGLGFGAGSTDGTYDIAFDWVTGTNAGAFAPGEENAVIGRSLLPSPPSYLCADRDEDGDIDIDDFAYLQRCYTGAGNTQFFDAVDCACYDRSDPRDSDIDEQDVARFVKCATGPNIAYVPNPPDCP